MKFKLDENLGTKCQKIFLNAGHDVQTVRDQGLQGCSDQHLFETCCAEKRCLLTLDLDFSEIIRFPPSQAYGIVIIRAPHNPSLALLERLINRFLEAVVRMSVERNLWIVEVNRIRVHEPKETNP